MKIILGAGLSGLICGALNAQSKIFERNPSSFVGHRAILRFRDDKIARSIGVPFRKVTVRKGIWTGSSAESASPRLSNLYSRKVRGVLAEASIWNLSTSERYIAPDDLHSILADICGSRVSWEHHVTLREIMNWRVEGKPVVSTIPLPLLLKLLYGNLAPGADLALPTNHLLAIPFSHSPIYVSRFNVPLCDLFQTIYFPNPGTSVYRATLTGPLLTIEGTAATTTAELMDVKSAFGIEDVLLSTIQTKHVQSFGKIAPVEDGPRKALLHKLTTEWGIYSLGRFATWRNILLDDVYDDIAAIRKMQTQSHYDVNLERTKQQ